MQIGRLESKLSSDLFAHKNRMTFVIRPFNLRRVRFRQKTPLSGLYWRFSELRSQLTYCRVRHHDYSSSHRLLLPFCFPDSHPLKIQGSSSTKSLERSERILKPPLISVFKGALRSFLSNNLSFGYNFLPSVICCQRTLASTASNGASRTQSQTCLSYAEAQPIECNVVANEASLFGTCKLIRIYL